tara:strand:- start:2998 stop:3579 length:582 start_codon:yes stop_codon:yes gene_type:complete
LAAISNGNKNQLRKNAFLKRIKLNNEIVDLRSQKITEQLFQNFNFDHQKTHLFYPIDDNKEVDTWKIHNRLKNKKSLFTSVYCNNLKKWECVSFSPLTSFKKGIYKIPFPENNQKDHYKKIDIIIIPLLIFDIRGNRIGYGKGIYDKILFSLNKNCIKIGVSLLECSDQLIDFQKHDIPLDYCQTSTVLHRFE